MTAPLVLPPSKSHSEWLIFAPFLFESQLQSLEGLLVLFWCGIDYLRREWWSVAQASSSRLLLIGTVLAILVGPWLQGKTFLFLSPIHPAHVTHMYDGFGAISALWAVNAVPSLSFSNLVPMGSERFYLWERLLSCLIVQMRHWRGWFWGILDGELGTAVVKGHFRGYEPARLKLNAAFSELQGNLVHRSLANPHIEIQYSKPKLIY